MYAVTLLSTIAAFYGFGVLNRLTVNLKTAVLMFGCVLVYEVAIFILTEIFFKLLYPPVLKKLQLPAKEFMD